MALPSLASAAPRVEIASIRFDPPGADDGSNDSLNGEYIELENLGQRAVTLTGWTIRNTDRRIYRFPTFRLAGGAKVKIHTGSGNDTRRDLYWGLDNYVWNNDGDTAILRDDGGTKRDTCGYSGSGSSVSCQPAG